MVHPGQNSKRSILHFGKVDGGAWGGCAGFTDHRIRRTQKYRRNWRSFIKLYNKISLNDVFVFQLFKEQRYGIYGLGVVKDKFYDDETPIWAEEIRQSRVIYPWRIRLSIMLFSRLPIRELAIHTHEYVAGYGIGTMSRTDLETIIDGLEEQRKLGVNIH